MIQALLRLLLIHRGKKPAKPKKHTAKKPAAKRTIKHAIKRKKRAHPAPRSGTSAKPGKAPAPKRATVAALA